MAGGRQDFRPYLEADLFGVRGGSEVVGVDGAIPRVLIPPPVRVVTRILLKVWIV